jgi:hypothetical protein
MKNNYLNVPNVLLQKIFTFLSVSMQKKDFHNGKVFFLLFFLFSVLTAQAQTYPFSGGAGSETNPFLIANRTDLDSIRHYIGVDNAGLYFKQTADIDLGASNWTPIGGSSSTLSNQFRGKFHGGGYKILNLKVNAQYGGLFGVVNAGAIIEDVHIVGGTIGYTTSNTSTYALGAIIGYIRLSEAGNVIVRNNSNSAAVNLDAISSTSVGAAGIVGYIYATEGGTVTVEQNENTGRITGNCMRVGGIIGYAYASVENSNLNISSNYNGGDVTGVLQTAGGSTQVRVGGIIGHLYITQANISATISNNFSYAKIETTIPSGQSYIGGIAGHLQATTASTGSTMIFEKNIAGGSIAGVTTNSELRTGGLIGYVSRGVSNVHIRYSISAQTVINRYSTNGHRILGSSATGDGTLTYTDNYAYKDTKMVNATTTITATDDANGNEGIGKTLAELFTSTTYSDSPLSWDFTDIWQIGNGTTYPYLKWQANRAGISNDYLPAVKYNYTGSDEKTIALDNANVPTEILNEGNKSFLDFEIIPPANGSAYAEYNPLFLYPGNDFSNKIFSISQSGIHALYFFNVSRTATTPLQGYTVTLKYKDNVTPDGTLIANADNNYRISRPDDPDPSDDSIIVDWYTDEAYTRVWDFTTIVTQDTTLYAQWKYFPALLGDGTPENPYLIKVQEHLDNIRTNLSAHFKLANDIELTFPESGNGWTPVANFSGNPASAAAFTGSLDGDGHKITGLWSKFTSSGQGLFAKSSGNIKNLRIEIDTKGIISSASTYYAGGLAGYVTGGSIDSVSVIGKENAQITGAAMGTGGLVGFVNGAATAISNSYAAIDVYSVIASTTTTGGLIGTSNGSIQNSYASGNVSAIDGKIGGLVGTFSGATIENSYASGNVSLTGSQGAPIGGLVGEVTSASTKIIHSYAAGNVTGTEYAGGLIGKALGEITNSFASGKVTGITTYNNSGAFVGNNGATLVGSGYNSEVNNELPAIGSDATNESLTALTSEKFKQALTYATWDLENSAGWGIYDGYGYPYVKTIGNHILITPDAAATEYTYTGSAIEVSTATTWTADANYDPSLSEITGNVVLPDGPFVNVGKYTILPGTVNLKNPYYQISFKDAIVIRNGLSIHTPLSGLLKATVTNGVLRIGGITAGEPVSVYNVQGTIIYRRTAVAGEQNIPLPVRGVYVVVAGEKKLKVVY